MVLSLLVPDEAAPLGTEEIKDLLRRAQAGDRDVLPTLRAWLDDHPEYWEKAGDLAAVAELSWIGLVANGNLAHEEALRRKLAALKEEVAGRDPPPLERLLTDRIALGWLQANYADAAYAQLRDKKCSDLRVYAAAQRRQESAQRRLMAAIKQLATVRRLLRSRPGDEEKGQPGNGRADRRAALGLRLAAVEAEDAKPGFAAC